ncbi:MAG: DegQ family serine endoprotease [Deltaproteobacteria bacterium]|nr:MAG: DegQ family serine endoprotease [Deltaproteobacteria bacterium]
MEKRKLLHAKALPFVLFFLVLFLAACERVPVEKKAEKKEAPPAEAVSPQVPPPSGVAEALEEAFVRVSTTAVPSVVNISTTPRTEQGEKSREGRKFHDFFDDLFPPGPFSPDKSLGSGVIISEDGYIVTNEHVVRDAAEITVRLSDRSEYRAKVVGADPKTDIAVLKIDAKGKLTPARLGDSSNLKVGQWAIAVGNPFGLNSTVTVGVISAIGRSDIGVETYEDFIQTDASINPGNSGGPLLNLRGEVIGINTAIISAGQGIGFAIPVNLVKNIVDQLITTGSVKRGWLGIGIQNLTPELASSFQIPGAKGVLINNVFEGSPAEKAGFRRGDVVVSFNGEPVETVRQLQKMVATYEVGKEATVEVIREGKKIVLNPVVGEMPKEENIFTFKEPEPDRVGLVVGEVPDVMRKSLGIEGGVRVESVESDSPAWKAGIRKGDVIVDINMTPISSLADYEKSVEGAKEGDVLSFLVVRKGKHIYLAVKL